VDVAEARSGVEPVCPLPGPPGSQKQKPVGNECSSGGKRYKNTYTYVADSLASRRQEIGIITKVSCVVGVEVSVVHF
jgi:hypothetical protein